MTERVQAINPYIVCHNHIVETSYYLGVNEFRCYRFKTPVSSNFEIYFSAPVLESSRITTDHVTARTHAIGMYIEGICNLIFVYSSLCVAWTTACNFAKTCIRYPLDMIRLPNSFEWNTSNEFSCQLNQVPYEIQQIYWEKEMYTLRHVALTRRIYQLWHCPYPMSPQSCRQTSMAMGHQ